VANFPRIPNNFYKKTWAIIAALVLFKTGFQLIILKSGLRWLTADDYSRTVISWDWLQAPRIFSGVWLSLHFWLNGLFIALFRDLTFAPIIANTLFSILTLVYLYLLFEGLFNRQIAILSCLIYSVFPFQVWLSTSGMPESIFFFFVTAGVYYFIKWCSSYKLSYLGIAIIAFNIANLLRYEGWMFSLTFIIFICFLSYKRFKFAKPFLPNSVLSILSLATAFWWLYQNSVDYGDAFFFIKETTRIFKDVANAGVVQRIVQYPFFLFYIAPVTTILALWKVYSVLRRRPPFLEGEIKRDSLVKLFLLFNLLELFLLMLTGIFGSGGTNMVSRYVVMNAFFLFPFAAWQILDFRKCVAVPAAAAVLLVNIIWSFYYQQAYREDTYEVAGLTRKLIQRNYFDADDKIYFETAEGYYDIYPLQVISNRPSIFVSEPIPVYFPNTLPSGKTVKKKSSEDSPKSGILELRKFLENKHITLAIVRSDMLIDKLRKLSYKNEQVGDYHIFYVAEDKIKYKKHAAAGDNAIAANHKVEIPPDAVSFGKKLILKDFRIDNTNLGLNPQTITLKWSIADGTILDSLSSDQQEFGRYYANVELSVPGRDSVVYETRAPIFSERIVEEFFETEEIKNILTLRPFAMLNYTFTKGRFRLTPFESGIYDVRLCILDNVASNHMRVYRGDSLFIHIPEPDSEIVLDSIAVRKRNSRFKEEYLKHPYYSLGRLIAVFPNVNYMQVLRKSKDLSQIMMRNALMLPFLQRYQGDHFLNIVFTYF
jgi:hypothetical protein